MQIRATTVIELIVHEALFLEEFKILFEKTVIFPIIFISGEIMTAQQRCRKSGKIFLVTEDDLEFYKKISPVFGGKSYNIPTPTLSPELRAMRRLAWGNSNYFYHRNCSKSGKPIISAYPASAPYPVYALDIWWGDEWEPLASGLEFDFERPFFDQFKELQERAPRPALMNRESENSDYCNYAGENRNCYLANNGSWYNENCLFGESYLRCRDAVDCSYLYKSELCYQCLGGEQLYDCAYLIDCHHCSGCAFSFNLRSCQDCLLCSNLRNKSNYILNQPASKAEISELRKKLRTESGLEELRKKFSELSLSSTHPAVQHVNCENSSGDYLTNCKNVKLGFIVSNVQDGKYLLHCDEAQDLWDCCLTGYTKAELYYETLYSGISGQRALFCCRSWSSNDVLYCDTIINCRHCFGCVGLRRQEYCILNKQYTKDEYNQLVPKIIEKMQSTKEWGEFFPEEIAPHAYNESQAQSFYPLTKEQAEKYGYRWLSNSSNSVQEKFSTLTTTIDEATEETCKGLYACQITGKPYKIVSLELSILKRMGIALPRICPEQRRIQRNSQRNQPLFYQRKCCISGAEVLTTYAPDRPEKVCSEECYLKLLQ